MKNFQITAVENGKKYWISRSMAIHGMLLLHDHKTGNKYILLERRGPKCPDEIGKWANPTGYLDWDETLLQGLYREVYEETGLKLSDLKKVDIEPNGIYDVITGENKVKQNVTIRYIVNLDYSEVLPFLNSGVINTDTKSRGGEDGEVSEIKLLDISNGEKVNPGIFAFNHGEIINKLIEKYNDNRKNII